MTDIPRLIEKLEAATEGSIMLDVEVLNACGFGSSDAYPRSREGDWIAPSQRIEDAIRLLEVVKPVWSWGVSTEPNVHGRTWHSSVNNFGFMIDPETPSIISGQASYVKAGPAAALMIAFLWALYLANGGAQEATA